MHLLKIKNPGQIPPVPEGRLTQKDENFLTSTALNEFNDERHRKICKSDKTIARSGAYRWTIDII